MAFHQGTFKPSNPSKYIGDSTNIQYRSGWESRFMRYCDSHPDIIQWQSEEVVVPYFWIISGKWHRYFPDFVLKKRNKDGSESIIMIEIKPEKETKPPVKTKNKTKKRLIIEAATYTKNKAKWKAAEAFCAQRGWQFKVITEKHLNVL